MGELQRIKNYIENKRKYLQELIRIKEDLTDNEIILVSQELDRAINLFYKMQNIKVNNYIIFES